MTDLIHIAERLFNRPLLLAPEKAQIILKVLGSRLGSDTDLGVDMTTPQASRFAGMEGSNGSRLSHTVDGVSVIPVIGSLVNRGAWLGARSGMTSYEGLDAQLRDAAAARDVKAILLDIDSPGGEATGMYQIASTIRSIRADKPVIAVVNDVAASAAYGIASAATEIVASPTSLIGSIGVIMVHLDQSAKLEKDGVRPTLIFAGEHKADANPFSSLSDNARAELQMRVQTFYDQFVNVVGEGRGQKLTADKARSTQARVFMGDEAVSLGLADRIASFADVLNGLKATPRTGQNPNRSKISMTTDNGSPAATNAGLSEADARAAERKRVSAIMALPEAKGREALATSLATETDMSAEAAARVLASAAKASGIEARGAGLPEVGGGSASDTGHQPAADGSANWAKHVARLNARFN